MILDVSNKPLVNLSDGKSWRKLEKKGIVIDYRWINGSPNMLLYKSNVLAAKVEIVAFSADDAWKYVQPNGYARKSLVMDCMGVAQAMGWDILDQHAVRSIADVVLEHLPDIKNMPTLEPKWNEKKTNVGEVTVKRDGKTLVEGLVCA